MPPWCKGKSSQRRRTPIFCRIVKDLYCDPDPASVVKHLTAMILVVSGLDRTPGSVQSSPDRKSAARLPIKAKYRLAARDL